MADIGESDDSQHGGSAAPHTPHSPRHWRAVSRHDNSDAPSSGSSPPVSPSLSLSSLGMSPLSPLRHRLPPPSLAPSSPLYPQSDPDHPSPGHRDHGDHDDTSRDGRDALVQRLNDLIMRLHQRPHAGEGSIDVLHAKVDELEHCLNTANYVSGRETHALPQRLPHNAVGDGQDRNSVPREQPQPDDAPLSDVSDLASLALPSSLARTAPHQQPHEKATHRSSNITVEQAEQMIAEVRDLHGNLEILISNLRDRQEETEHIHALLIARLERAAQRIIYLEEQLRDSEAERKESARELLNLRIQLKAIEVRCLAYVPRDADPELSESIDAWNMEWAALKQRKAKEKERQRQQQQQQQQQIDNTPMRRRTAALFPYSPSSSSFQAE